MADAGLRGYFIGFESGNERVLKFSAQGHDAGAQSRSGQDLSQYGVRLGQLYAGACPPKPRTRSWTRSSCSTRSIPTITAPAFYTPHPGSDLYDYCVEQDLSLITDYDSYRRNPTEPKIKGQDYEFLKWARDRSQERLLKNRVRRSARAFWSKYSDPAKYVRKVRRVLGIEPVSAGEGAEGLPVREGA